MRLYQENKVIAGSLALLLAGAIFICHADFKVGSYSWSQLWQSGSITGIPTANQYGTGYTHLDLSWSWTMEEGFQKIGSDWTRAADCLDDNPSWYAGHMSMQVGNYVVKTKNPALWNRIKAHSDAGRYDGGALDWNEGYWSFGGDGYYLRNYYISTRFCQDNFGYLPVISACYDLDAPAWSQPKMQTYITGRSAQNPTGVGFYNHNTGFYGIWNPQGTTSGTSYKWTSDDGSTVIVGTGGNWTGDGGGAETCVKSAGNSRSFAGKVLQENVWNTTLTTTVNNRLGDEGSGYSLFFWGSKICENRLLEAEKFSTFARQFGYTYPLHGDAYLYDTWGRLLLFNQHDVADVQGSPWQMIVSNPTNTNLQDAIVHALNVADSATNASTKVIARNVNTTGNGTSVIACNSLSWTRSDYVMVPTSDLGYSSPVSVRDPNGTEIPCQVINDRGVSKLVFIAENVPSMGLREFKASNTTPTVTKGATGRTTVTEYILDNQYLTVKVNRVTGAITSLYDKVNAKELISGPGNQIASTTATPFTWDDCCGMFSHEPGMMPLLLTYAVPTSVQLVDSGLAIARVKVLFTIDTVAWEHSIMLFSSIPIVINRMTTNSLSHDNELVVNMPLSPSVSNSLRAFNYGTAYGHHEIPYSEWGWDKTYMHKWADVVNDAKTYGVSLLENNCTIYTSYGWSREPSHDHDLRLVLIGARTSRYTGHWSKTDWEMSWGYWGHMGDWTNGTVQKGYEFNSPLIARVEASHGGTLPKEYSFLTVEPENIIATVAKKWESESPTRNDSLTMQVRFYEIDGKNTNAVLKFPSSRPIVAWESQGNEYGVYGTQLPVTTDPGVQKVTFATGHNQIRSLKVQMPFTGTSAQQGSFNGVQTPGLRTPEKVRVCNAMGQTIWQGSSALVGNMMLRNLSSKGVFFVQYLAKDGAILQIRKFCGWRDLTHGR